MTSNASITATVSRDFFLEVQTVGAQTTAGMSVAMQCRWSGGCTRQREIKRTCKDPLHPPPPPHHWLLLPITEVQRAGFALLWTARGTYTSCFHGNLRPPTGDAHYWPLFLGVSPFDYLSLSACELTYCRVIFLNFNLIIWLLCLKLFNCRSRLSG